MTHSLSNKFLWVQSSDIQNLISALSYPNHVFAFVGGCVRDSLLNLPINDIDIASNFTPQENMNILTKAGYKVIPSGIKYGTITLVLNNINYEITSLRADIKTDGRHAEVLYTKDFKIDAERRDFSFNALYLNPKTLEITDYFNGISDLKNAAINFIGNANERISEDYLRILRYFRFLKLIKSTFTENKNPSEELVAILQKNAPKLSLLSAERVFYEIFKIITKNNHNNSLSYILLLMDKCSALQIILKNNYLLNNIKNVDLLITTLEKFKILNDEETFIAVLGFILNNPAKLDFLNVNSYANKINNIIEIKNLIIKLRLNETFEFTNLAINFGFNEAILATLCVACGSKNLYNIYLNMAQQLFEKQKLVFPVNGQDLIDLKIPAGAQIGEHLKKLKQLFYANSTLSKQDLLKKL
jgi:poly(A) polymerase